jgi:hypothetical protein
MYEMSSKSLLLVRRQDAKGEDLDEGLIESRTHNTIMKFGMIHRPSYGRRDKSHRMDRV